MQLNPYLTFNGECEAALKFYEACGVGQIEVLVPHAGTPAETHVPADWRDKILHARVVVGDSVLMASDAPPDRYQKPQGISVSLQLTDPAEAERLFNALAEGATVKMPIQETFWATRFGMLNDRFGIPWMINCQRPE